MAARKPAPPAQRPVSQVPAERPVSQVPADRPVLLVLAGVNGAGKSSIGGNVVLKRAGMNWFNPDTYTRLLVDCGLPLHQANARAWQHGVDLIDQALAGGYSHAFETTLGDRSMTQKIAQAAHTHDVLVWFCGLASPEQHIARVAARVAAGGHDIPEAKIHERWVQAPLNLIALMPVLHELRVFDNSAQVAAGQPVADPVPVLQVQARAVLYPTRVKDLQRTPAWAKPIVQAARDLQRA